MRIRREILATAVCAAGLMLGGCASSSLCQAVPGRSLTLDSPAQQALAQRSPQAGLPWYAARNDVGPSVTVGVSSPTYQQSFSYTYDQIYSSNGRVWDNYSQTTYRQRYQETVH